MAAKTPQAYGNGNGQPTSSLGTTAVNGNTAYYSDYSQPATPNGAAFDPSASSSPQHQHFQEFYAPSPSYNHQPEQPLPENGYEETLSNTLANSHLSTTQPNSHQHYDIIYSPAPKRPTGRFTEEWDASQRGSSIIDGPVSRHIANHISNMQRSNSTSGSTTGGGGGGMMDGSGSIQVSRNNTLRKRSSLRRSTAMGRSSSRRSMTAGSVRSLALQSNPDEDEMHSAFYCPVPTTGNPTEALATRFQAWRKILKDIITYFKEIQTHYEQRSKSLVKLANILNNVHMPPGFLPSGGLDDAVQILRNYNSQAILEANKAREIEEDVILALTGLRSDLQLKIKEIKNLSGDFRNSVDKEMEATKRAVRTLQDALGRTDLDSSLTTGKEDPYLLRLAVDRQLERQIDEENYLHQAYFNLENSGRELESIVVGEIQKSYNAYTGILKREADAAYYAIEELRVGPIAMPKDHEWVSFVKTDDQFIDPNIPIRSPQYIHYPGKDHFACQEIRAGLLERKTKYLKSYTAGWYVLSPTHLHEFKSADKTQSPVMSLYLPEQKLGSHSQESGSSPKFILKGRQAGGVHRGHSWVFRAESYDTMIAWYEDIKALTEKTPQERSDFVRGHSRSFSRTSSRRSISSDGMVDDDDEEPYSAHNSAAALGQIVNGPNFQQDVPRRPSPGGRFPSDIEVNAQRGLQASLSPSSVNSRVFSDGKQPNTHDNEIIAAAGALPGSSLEQYYPEIGHQNNHGGATQAALEVPENATNPFIAQQDTAPYANHPAVLIAARATTQNGTAEDDGTGNRGLGSQGTTWLAGDPVEAASIPVIDDRRTPQPTDGVAPSGQYAIGIQGSEAYNPAVYSDGADRKEFPKNGVVSMPFPQTNGSHKGPQERPAMSDRTESDTLSLSSEVPTISNLHIPGEYPNTYVN